MKHLTANYVDDRTVIVHIATDAVPLEKQNEAINALNEEYGLEHWEEHEDRVTFGLLSTCGDNGLEVELCAILDDMVACVPLNDT